MSDRSTSMIVAGAIAAAALVMQIGCAAAATPLSDFQSQVGAVLAGDIASHSPVRASSLRDEAAGSRLDSQQFVRQLLLGGSASVARRARSAARSASSATPGEIREESPAHGEIQIEVQRLLLGLHGAARGGASNREALSDSEKTAQ
jgi:hypothetical protein